MTEQQILNIRLHNQQLAKHDFKTAAEVVAWLGAVQAQDYLGALWSVGMRLKNADESLVEKALQNGTIVRSWPMRGTLHFTSPDDLRWMLKYLASRIKSKMQSVLRKDGVDEKMLSKSKKIWEKELQGKGAITRDEMYALLENAKIGTSGTRGLHMLGDAAQQGLICFGPRQGKQQTFVLLDEWIPSKKPILEKDEAMARLATLYIQSHGPIVVEDLAWWAGITKTEAKSAIESVRDKVKEIKLNDRSYFFFDDEGRISSNSKTWLLPTYDEYGVAYKERSLFITPEDWKKAGSFFTSAIMHKGKMTGLWKRTLEKDSVKVVTKKFRNFTEAEKKSLSKSLNQYSNFLDLKLK